MDAVTDRVPVVALTGPLGAGKTTLLNHLLRRPGARVGVIVNDFGAVNIDAALVEGLVDETASIAGGCVCCLDDASGLDDALARLADPRRGLDVIVVEASGIAEPGALARMIRYSGVDRVRPGGVVDLVDAVEYFDHHDGGGLPPARFAVASLVAITKADLLPAATREATLAAIEARVREANPDAHLVRVVRGRLDPALLHDVASTDDPPDQLPLGALLRGEEPGGHGGHGHDHAHDTGSATASTSAPVQPGLLVDLLESPPPQAYRLKGVVAVQSGPRRRAGYVVHVVGRQVHVHTTAPPDTSTLVAVGAGLDPAVVEPLLVAALAPADDTTRPDPAGLRRLRRHRLLSE